MFVIYLFIWKTSETTTTTTKHVFFYIRADKQGKCFEESLRGVKVVKNLGIIWMYKYWIGLYYWVKKYADLGGCYPQQPNGNDFNKLMKTFDFMHDSALDLT